MNVKSKKFLSNQLLCFWMSFCKEKRRLALSGICCGPFNTVLNWFEDLKQRVPVHHTANVFPSKSKSKPVAD